jgi:hypothetical protein
MNTTKKSILVVATATIAITAVSYPILARAPDESTRQPVPAAINRNAESPSPRQVDLPKQAPAPVQPAQGVTQKSAQAAAPQLADPGNPPPAALDPQMQDAMATMATMKQSFGDLYATLMKSDDSEMALQKIYVFETQMDELQSKVKGTPLEQQIAPVLKPIKDIQAALENDDLAGARKIMQSLNLLGPKVQQKIENTAGMTIDQAAKTAGSG